MHKVSLIVDDDMHTILKQRAKSNRRSLMQEVLYLIEVALGSEHSIDIHTVRNWLLAQGGTRSLRGQSEPTPEQTETAEPLPETPAPPPSHPE